MVRRSVNRWVGPMAHWAQPSRRDSRGGADVSSLPNALMPVDFHFNRHARALSLN